MKKFGQVDMSPLYGISHYILGCLHQAFFRGEVIGLENIPSTGPFIIAANHASHLDPPFIGAHIQRQMAFFARKSLWANALATRWLDGVGAIPVDRDSGSDVSAMKRVLSALKAGYPITLFPEGTRSKNGELQPSKPGVGMIASKSGVPVIPTRIFGSFNAFGRGGKLKIGVNVSIVYGKRLDISGRGKDYALVSDMIMSEISRLSLPVEVVI